QRPALRPGRGRDRRLPRLRRADRRAERRQGRRGALRPRRRRPGRRPRPAPPPRPDRPRPVLDGHLTVPPVEQTSSTDRALTGEATPSDAAIQNGDTERRAPPVRSRNERQANGDPEPSALDLLEDRRQALPA